MLARYERVTLGRRRDGGHGDEGHLGSVGGAKSLRSWQPIDYDDSLLFLWHYRRGFKHGDESAAAGFS